MRDTTIELDIFGGSPPILALDDPRSLDAELVGAKASSLAHASAAGLPVLPGFVLTTAACSLIASTRDDRLTLPAGLATALQAVWEGLSRDGARALVVRSSSSMEDGKTSSMAGMFTSVLGVSNWPTFLESLAAVLASGRRAGLDAPMAVLVQPQLEVARGGVMFTLDPVTGRSDRIMVAAVLGGPDKLVDGSVQGTRMTLSRGGRLLQREGDDPKILKGGQRRALARIAERAQVAFDGPQDVEWAFDLEGKLWLLQSRPITAMSDDHTASGPILGPGPVAETFPDALEPLEEDLWIEPLRAAIEYALLLVGSVGRRRLSRSPVLVTVAGRAAVDLELFGVVPNKKKLSILDPRPAFRRLGASWRVGRLRAAMPALAGDLIDRVDEELSLLRPVRELTDDELISLLGRTRQALVALHGHEIMAGVLLTKGTCSPSAASLGMGLLAKARAKGMDDDDAVAAYPAVLALTAPAIRRRELPPVPEVLPDIGVDCHPLAAARESLRLRARWIQELTIRIARELGSRLATREILLHAEDVARLRLEELRAVVSGDLVVAEFQDRSGDIDGAPLPAAFRLTASGKPAPVVLSQGTEGQGAGGGRGIGRVANGSTEPGDVLVVRNLDPTLAPKLPGLAGLVAETGSVLSHLAILAREYGVPTVV
ncbi:MAG: PEP/pyruvate-binding domain-containing protein, partial [Actinomycetota bacterium]